MSFYGIFFPRAAYYAGTKGEISLTGLVISTWRPASDFRSCFARIASLSSSAVRRKYSPTVHLLTLRVISKGALCHFFIEITGEDHRRFHHFLLLLDFLRFWKAYRRYYQYAIGLRDFCAVYRAELLPRTFTGIRLTKDAATEVEVEAIESYAEFRTRVELAISQRSKYQSIRFTEVKNFRR